MLKWIAKLLKKENEEFEYDNTLDKLQALVDLHLDYVEKHGRDTNLWTIKIISEYLQEIQKLMVGGK